MLRTPGSDVTAYTTVVTYGRHFLGRRLLRGLCNSQNFSFHDGLSLIHAGGWRLEDCGLDK
jgi:hypothetical protein